MTRPYLPDRAGRRPTGTAGDWSYLALDEDSGYGVAAERCMAALEESDLRLEWTPFVAGPAWGLGYQPLSTLGEPAPVVVAHLVPEYLPSLRERWPDVFLIAHTVWDTDRLPAHWIADLNAADLVVVPSRFSADAIANSQVTTPVAVIPHVAPALPPRTPDPSTDDASERFVFYTVAEWNERKAVFRTVEAYLRAFTSRDPVVLVIKTSHRDQTATQSAGGGTAGAGTTAWSLARVLAGHRDPPAVQLVTRALTGAEITTLHRRGHCFVSLCRSEGWGLGAFDAAAHGKPVVTTGFGGHLDYLAGSPYLVGFELVPVIDPAGAPSYTPDQRWAEPDVDHAAALMRQIAADRQQASAVAAPIAAEVRRRYRPETIAAAFQSAVEQHRFREPMVPTMPTTSRRP